MAAQGLELALTLTLQRGHVHGDIRGRARNGDLGPAGLCAGHIRTTRAGVYSHDACSAPSHGCELKGYRLMVVFHSLARRRRRRGA
jgi:hypothetical protein